MDRKLIVLTTTLLAASFAGAVDLNGTWDFGFAEGRSIEQSFVPGFGTTDRMTVPGCFDMMPKWLMKKGTGLYRRTFALEKPMRDAVLRVEGLGLRGAFRLDGRDIGLDELPWSTVELKAGALAAGEHVLEAAIDNRLDPKTNRLFYPDYDFYSFGGFFHGLSLSESEPKVFVRVRDYRTGEIEVEVANEVEKSGRGGQWRLVFDGKHEIAATFRNGRAVVKVPDFKLWSPDSPHLHKLIVHSTPSPSTFTCAPQVRFGIRQVSASNGQLYLNGKPLYLKGVNRHESHPDQGAATTEDLMLKDLQLLKSLGGNFIRGAHYPQCRRFLDLCDELGVLVWEESLGWNNFAESKWSKDRVECADPEFRRLQVEQTKLMVRNSFNHPSVIMFGFLNECQSSHSNVVSLVGELAAAIRSQDSGRLVTFACSRTPTGIPGRDVDAASVHCDVVSFNTYPGWIDFGGPGDRAQLRNCVLDGTFGIRSIAKRFRQMYPDKPIIVSECGTCGVYGQRDPAGAQWTEEFQAEYDADVVEAVRTCPDLCGVALWQFADARSYHRDGAVRCKPFAYNLAGLFDGYRRPKLAAEAVRKAFSKKAVFSAARPPVVLDLPASPTNPRNSEGDFIRLKDGRILFVYSHYTKGTGADHDPAFLASRESSDGGLTWTAKDVQVVANEGAQNVMSVSLLRLKNGSIALFYAVKNSIADCRPVMRVSTDEAKTWGPPVKCVGDAEKGYYVLNNSRVLQLPSGRLVLPLCLHSAEDQKANFNGKLLCYVSDDSGRTWRRGKSEPFPIHRADGKRILTQEPGLVLLKDGRVLMVVRTDQGRQWYCYSSDDCETWTKGEPSALLGPTSPATIVRLKNGDLLAVWNDHESHPDRAKNGPGWAHGVRTPLTLAISKDEGRTWPIRRDLADQPNGWYCYFAVMEIDGRLLIGTCAMDWLRHAQVYSVPVDWIYAAEKPGAPYGKIITDASALPSGKWFIADTLAVRVNERSAESRRPLTVAYRLDPSLGGETARVTVKGDRAEIVAARPRALYYGMGKLMREMRWTAGGFTLADGTWEVKPVKPLRVAYWARHFHNWYHTSSAAELKRYAEDMLLNGVNCLNYQYFYPAVNVAGARPDEVATFERNSKALYDHLVAMDADYLAFGGGNQLPADSPEEYRGVPETDWRRGNLGFNACPAKPKALKAMLDGRNRGIDRSLKDGVKPSWFLNWPFDEGGCECEKCRPWGGNGFIGLCRQFDEINKRRVLGCKTMLATWTYHDDDYAGLWEYLKKPESAWIDGLMIDDHEDFPKWPLKYGIPRNLPVITFPEISMWGRWPWGGTGAIAMPARFERLFRQAEKIASGFMFYSEGLSEDVNKFVVTGLYVDPTRHWQELVRDYARQWLPGLDAERFVELVTLMEKTQKNPIWERLNSSYSDEKAAAFLPTSVKMRDLVRTLETGLLPSQRTSWRWRLIRLRSEIEAQAWAPGGGGSEELRNCLREVNEIYHAEKNPGDYCDSTHGSVRAPLTSFARTVRPGEEVTFDFVCTNRSPKDYFCCAAFGKSKVATGKCGIVNRDGTVEWNAKRNLKPGESATLRASFKVAADAPSGTACIAVERRSMSLTVLPRAR